MTRDEGMSDKKSFDYDFISEMDHEICTPMNTILGDLEMILQEPVSDKVRGIVHDIQVAADGLMTVVNDVIDYDLLKSGAVELSEEEYSITNLVGEIEEQGNRIMKERNIRCHISVSRTLSYRYYGDYGKITKVINKLLANSLIFVHEGEMELDLSCRDEERDFSVLCITLKDSSDQGVCDEIVSLFESFEQDDLGNARASTRRLFLAKMYAELIGGSLKVEKTEDGIRYIFEVRQRKIGINTIEDIEDSDDIKLSEDITFWISNARVLVVDDNLINARIAYYILKSFGVDADIVDNGYSVIELVKRIDYDIVFMDYMMPEISGTEIASIIRHMEDEQGERTEYYKNVPIIAWTASAEKEVTERIIKSGMDECLAKPLDIKKIEGILKRWLPMEKFRDLTDIHRGYSEVDALERIGIKARTALRSFSNKEKEYRDVLESFCKSSTTKRDLIRRYLKQKDYQNYILSMHGLVGISRVVGAKWLADKAKALEDAVKDGRRETIVSDTAAFLDYMEKLIVLVEKIIRKNDEESVLHGRVDQEDLIQLIDELINSFDTYQIEQAEELFYNLAQHLYDNDDVMEHIHSAEVFMMDYDFKGVMQELETVKQMLS